jgi:hypothetical protein
MPPGVIRLWVLCVTSNFSQSITLSKNKANLPLYFAFLMPAGFIFGVKWQVSFEAFLYSPLRQFLASLAMCSEIAK